MLADRKRSIYFAGGRITRVVAEYFFNHMQVIRHNTVMISANSSGWPQYVLNMNEGDVLVVLG